MALPPDAQSSLPPVANYSPVSEEKVLAALPAHGFLRDYVLWAMQRTDAHAAYHLAGGLSILTQTIPEDMFVDSGKLASNFYSLIVGDSTKSRKTTAISLARRLLEDALPGRVAEEPGSAEGLVDGLRLSPRQLICYGEFGQFLSAAVQGHMSNVKTAYTNIYDGQPIGRRTVKKQLGVIQKPRLSLLAASTPEYLEDYTLPIDWTGGFLCRWLILAATREREFIETPPNPEATEKQLIGRLQELASFTNAGPCAGKTVEASQLWRAWVQEKRSIKAGREEVVSSIERAEGFALKIAGILSWEEGNARSGQPWQISAEAMESAIAITNLHLSSIFSVVGLISINPTQRLKRKILRVIDRHKAADLGMITFEAGLLKRHAMEILETLLTEDAIVSAQTAKGSAGYSLSATGAVDFAPILAPTFSAPSVLAALTAADIFPADFQNSSFNGQSPLGSETSLSGKGMTAEELFG